MSLYFFLNNLEEAVALLISNKIILVCGGLCFFVKKKIAQQIMENNLFSNLWGKNVCFYIDCNEEK